MSKIGRKVIEIPENVKIDIASNIVKVSGPKGELELNVPHKIKLAINENLMTVTRAGDDKPSRSLHGLWRMLLANAIKGVNDGWSKALDYKGVGFKAEVEGNKLTLNVGFSHPVEIIAPEGIEITVTKNVINVSGIDKQKVGQVAANIRAVKPVEPYKGKGIKYVGEIVRKKLGKQAKAASGSGA